MSFSNSQTFPGRMTMRCGKTCGVLLRGGGQSFCSNVARDERVRGISSDDDLNRPISVSAKLQVDKALRENESSTVVLQDAVYSIDVNQVAANNPIEDYHSTAKCVPSTTWLTGIFDGHGGSLCSRHIASRLFDYICAAVLPKHTNPGAQMPISERLQWLLSSSNSRLAEAVRDSHMDNVQNFHRDFLAQTESATVRKALQSAFLNLDEDVSRGAMPNKDGKVCRMSAGAAVSGTCAVVAHIRGQHLHIANVGDSGAVLGVCGPQGGWTARQLSREHTVENPDETKRIREAHPAKEWTSVLRGGRLLGQLYPLRAFGDVRYKWSADLQKVVLEPIYGSSFIPDGLETPPYLTAAPEVFYHRLTPNDRFLVLASDGLWEWLEPDTVVRLLSDHMFGVQTLTPYISKSGLSMTQLFNDLRSRKAGEAKKPLDENSATHIIRHALAASGSTEVQYRRLSETLRLPLGEARNYRDDITVTVIYFNQNYLLKVQEDDV